MPGRRRTAEAASNDHKSCSTVSPSHARSALHRRQQVTFNSRHRWCERVVEGCDRSHALTLTEPSEISGAERALCGPRLPASRLQSLCGAPICGVWQLPVSLCNVRHALQGLVKALLRCRRPAAALPPPPCRRPAAAWYSRHDAAHVELQPAPRSAHPPCAQLEFRCPYAAAHTAAWLLHPPWPLLP